MRSPSAAGTLSKAFLTAEAEDVGNDCAKRETSQTVVAPQQAEGRCCLWTVILWALMHSDFSISCVAWVSLLKQPVF